MAINFPTLNDSISPQSTSSGGTYYVSTSGLVPGVNNYIHVFTATGTTYFTASVRMNVSFLAVAGGGGGGGGQGNPNPAGANFSAGGGGGGGVVTGTFTVTAGVYAITIGSGGAGGVVGTNCSLSGGNSTIIGTGVGITALGGGFGSNSQGAAGPGGSGGGGASSPVGSALQPAQAQTATTYFNYGSSGGAGFSGSPSLYPGGGGGGGAIGTSGNKCGGQALSNNFTYQIHAYVLDTLNAPSSFGGGGGGAGGGIVSSNIGGVAGAGAGNGGSPGPACCRKGGSGVANRGGGGGAGKSQIPGINGDGGAGGPGIVVLSYAANQSAPLYNGQTFTTGTTATGIVTFTYSSAQARWVTNLGTTATLNVSITGISCQANTGTGAIALPAGTTAQRVTPIRSGAMRYNTDNGMVEAYYTTTGWTANIGNTQTNYVAQYLAIGGGGGGGSGGTPGQPSGTIGGYGGSGGVAQGFINLTAGVTYTVTVGTGGAGSSVGQPCRRPAGAAGCSTTMTGSPSGAFFLANGGTAGTGVQSSGAFSGTPGSNASAPIGGSPSATPLGIYSDISGSSVVYGQGFPAPGSYGVGGTPGAGNGPGPGGNGASGVVFIKYPGSQRGLGGNGVTSVGTYTLHTFTGPGTYVA